MLLTLSAVFAGVSLCTAAWAVMRPAARRSFAAGTLADRRILMLAWPWVVALQPVCEPFLSWRTRARLNRALELAGLTSSWQPAHVVALQILALMSGSATMTFACVTMLELSPGHALFWGALLGCATAWLPSHSIASAGRRRQQQMLRELPFLLDITTLCVEAGLSLHGALQQAAQHGPPGPLRHELQHTLADIRAGTARLDALWKFAGRTQMPAVASLVAALAQADQLGSSLGPVLRAQSDQRRAERFLRAEEQALKAPVKMLLPMVICIFPCTFLIIGFPIASKLLQGTF